MQGEEGREERAKKIKREKGGKIKGQTACVLSTQLSYTPLMLGSIFLVPDCMGITLATLAAAERLVVLGEPLGALFEVS